MALRTHVTVRLGPQALAYIDRIGADCSTEERAVGRSDVIRLAVKHGLAAAERELKRNAP